ncbi:hypothetical protein MPH_03827, partial [Macrophomina phaseolina MS6]
AHNVMISPGSYGFKNSPTVDHKEETDQSKRLTRKVDRRQYPELDGLSRIHC